MISSAGDATLSVADPASTNTGKLVNGAFALPQTLQARANAGTYADVGGSANPTTLLTYGGPISNDSVTLGFRQAIGANDALRTGTVQQDADVHPVDDDAIGSSDAPKPDYGAGPRTGPRRGWVLRLWRPGSWRGSSSECGSAVSAVRRRPNTSASCSSCP